MKSLKFFALAILPVLLLSIPSVLAETGLSVTPIKSFVFKELEAPATYELTVKNGENFEDNFYIDTLLDIEISPKSLGSVAAGGTKRFTISVNPSQDLKSKQAGKNFAFEYFVRGDRSKLAKDSITVGIFSFPDALEITFPPSIDPEQKEVTVGLRFRHDITLSANVKATSELLSDTFSVKDLSIEKQEAVLTLNDLKGKNAGVYKITFEFEIDGEKVIAEKDMVLSPVVTVKTDEETTGGILSSETKVTKTNNGNSATDVSILLNRSVVSSLFTTFSDAPKTRKDGRFYLYEWEKELNPGESYTVSLKTNYYVPFLVFLLLLLALVVFKIVTKSPVEITKKVARVRTKSGAFAAKIIISAKNTGKPVSNVKIIDRLPAFTEILSNKFSVLTPSEIKKRSVVWSIPQMSTGEEIMFSYIVYSKVNIFGRLEVPPAVVTFIDSKDNFLESQSDKIYIISEEEKKEEDLNPPL